MVETVISWIGYIGKGAGWAGRFVTLWWNKVEVTSHREGERIKQGVHKFHGTYRGTLPTHILPLVARGNMYWPQRNLHVEQPKHEWCLESVYFEVGPEGGTFRIILAQVSEEWKVLRDYYETMNQGNGCHYKPITIEGVPPGLTILGQRTINVLQ